MANGMYNHLFITYALFEKEGIKLFLPLLRRFNLAEPVVEKSVILKYRNPRATGGESILIII